MATQNDNRSPLARLLGVSDWSIFFAMLGFGLYWLHKHHVFWSRLLWACIWVYVAYFSPDISELNDWWLTGFMAAAAYAVIRFLMQFWAECINILRLIDVWAINEQYLARKKRASDVRYYGWIDRGCYGDQLLGQCQTPLRDQDIIDYEPGGKHWIDTTGLPFPTHQNMPKAPITLAQMRWLYPGEEEEQKNIGDRMATRLWIWIVTPPASWQKPTTK